MFIAVDDTDSRTGGCTTFLLTEMIRELNDVDLIGNPRLIRLNPAVPWKTRGNASLVIETGKGKGQKKQIGNISGKDIFSYDSSSEEPDAAELLERLAPIVDRNRSEGSQSGLIVSEVRPDPSLYWAGVRTILTKDVVDKELERIGAKTYTVGSGRGLIGATCGLAWIPGDFTYELIAYRQRERWGTERFVDPRSIGRMDAQFQSTFNSWEERFSKVTMVPSTPCPILYGLRGDDERELPEASASIISEDAERWMIFKTNQGTDDHITWNATELIPDRSYGLSGTVAGKVKRMKGGHALIDVSTMLGMVTCAAYEPSKEFRMLFNHLIPGDIVTVLGELRNDPRTLNVEKIGITSLAEDIEESNPACPSCGKRMKSSGKGQGYRCKACRTHAKDTETTTKQRQIAVGWYEPPAAARRHLSKPLKRMGVQQPLDFVNSRSE